MEILNIYIIVKQNYILKRKKSSKIVSKTNAFYSSLVVYQYRGSIPSDLRDHGNVTVYTQCIMV